MVHFSPTANGKSPATPVDPDEPQSTRAPHIARSQLTQVDPCSIQSLTPPAPVDPNVDAGPCEVQVDASFAGLLDPGSICLSSGTEVEFGLPLPPPRHRHYPFPLGLSSILDYCIRIDNHEIKGPKNQVQDQLHSHAPPPAEVDKTVNHPTYGHMQPCHATLQAVDHPGFFQECNAATFRFCPVQSRTWSRSHCDSRHHMPIQQCRLEHESPITDLVANMPADQPPADLGPNWQGRQPPVPPAFVADLSNRFTRMGFDVNDGDFDVPLRTWYIDHATIRRWTAPRNLQLVGPPHGWEAQISSIWVDQINPDEWFDVTIIHPDPPRPPRHSFIIMDVVVTQSIQLDRYAGLVTVSPLSSASFDMFSVAASFETDVSGFDIAQAADAAAMCSYQECTVTFGWQVIPYTLRPQHIMSHGDGFQLQIHSTPAQMASQTNSQAGSSTDTRSGGTLHHAPSAASDDVQSHVVPVTSQFTTPLYIYQMDGMDTVVQLVNAQLAQPSHTIADALRVPFNCIEALHIMPISPDAFPELAIPAIVQRVGDIPLHSTDRLIMIDVIYHHHPTATGSTNQPTVVRGVHRVTHHVSRRQILFKAAVFHYCEYLQEGCGVSLDGFLWPITHTDPRPVSHGSYATVDVPPPYGHEVDTQVAANTLHHDGTTDAMMDFLMEPMDLAEDTTFLTQLFASKMVIASVAKYRLRWCARDIPLPKDAENCNVSVHDPCNHARPSGQTIAQANSRYKAEPQHDAPSVVSLQVQKNECPLDQFIDTTGSTTDLCQGRPLCLRTDDGTEPKLSRAEAKNSSQVQTSISNFFAKKSKKSKAKLRPPDASGQTSIRDFFGPKAAVTTAHPAAIASLPSSPCMQRCSAPKLGHEAGSTEQPQSVQATEHQIDPIALATPSTNQCKCSQEQEAEPPNFATNRPQPQALPAPRRAPRPAWRIHLSNLFEELATVVHPETGPVMQVEVWYVHHDSYPECVAPRVVELDNIQDLWYADLCNVWLDRVQRHQPLRVLNVLPTPPYHTRPRTVAHIILEQGLHPQKVAIHFTTIFLGGIRVGLFQRAESAPERICTQDMIDRHGFQLQCAYRQCHMHSGLLRFSMYDPEEIFSGISAVLTVAPPPPEPEAASVVRQLEAPVSHSPQEEIDENDDTALMQATSSSHRPPSPTPGDMQNTVIGFNHRMTPAALVEFRQTLEWQARELGHRCSVSAQASFQVRSWYLNSYSRIRTEDSRTLLLDAKPHTWHHTIIDRWRDLLEPDHPVQLHVVLPNPPAESLEPEVHVILLQRPNPLWRSAVLTVSYPHIDVWSMQFLAVMLDVNTDHEQLGFISGVTHPSNPQAHVLDIEVTHGQVTLARDSTFPVRHGFWFDVRAVRRDNPEDDSHALIQTHFQSIRTSIKNIQARLQYAALECMNTEDNVAGNVIPNSALSAAVMPNEPQTFVDPCSALAFFTALQALWQPLALLQPPALPALVPVVTWYVDHIRFPQCFQPRLVLLNHDPTDWIQRIRSVWIDVVMPQHVMHVHLVQPAPPDMPPHLAAHLIVVQQPIATFRSVVFTSFDSDAAQGHSNRHATMAPTPVAFPTVLALAYHDTVCQQPQNECAVWVGNDELGPTEQLPLIDGHSVVLALHRHHMPLPEGATTWDSAAHTPTPIHPHHGARPPVVQDALLMHTTEDACMPRHSVSVPCPGFPVLLSLEAVLPLTRVSQVQPWQEDISAIAWNASRNWFQQVSDSLDIQLSSIPTQMTCTPSTWNAIFEAMEAPIGPYELIEVFVDGATSAVAASWSLVLVAHHDESQRLLGTLAGPVITGTAHPCWLGASSLDNIAAELSALAAALATVMQYQFSCPVFVRPDLSLSRLIAQELVTTVSNPRLAQLCRILAAWSPPNVNFKEVRGHTKHAWNDLADSLAKHVLQAPDQFSPIDFGKLHHLAREPHDLVWAWIQGMPRSFRQCFPNEVQDTIWQFAPSPRQVELPVTPPIQKREPVAFQCRMATINVLALDRTDSQKDVGRRTGARTTRLDHQLHAADIHIAGLQETRTIQGQYRTEHYLILSSGGAGQNAERSGCELWLHRTLPLFTAVNHGKVTLADCTCVVAHADPRRLFVRIEHAALCLTAIVLHAPCLGKATGDATAPIDVIKQWWTQTTAIWHQAVANDMRPH